MYRNLR